MEAVTMASADKEAELRRLISNVSHQMSALTFYPYEQPVVDYCHAHQPLRLNMSYEGPPQVLGDLPLRERSTVQTVALPAVPPSNSGTIGPPPSLGVPAQGPGIPYPSTERSRNYPSTERPTGTLTFGR
ncbi:hypothetical protein P4O66_000190 [Electrophorus voltai]|uniref:Uncharacterized protein n=1 Tax=Electrophorus voltai TaxID=2609070 RepID=A0AAD8ZL23_9TELE|nr:hypothetical protein P4O66_000190 [Electrophorus voltai]